MLEAKELMVFYENMLALNNVSITAETGSVIGIFGSNSVAKAPLCIPWPASCWISRKRGDAGRRKDNALRQSHI